MKTFSFPPPINIFEEGKWLLAVTSFEATNSVVLSLTDENNGFSITTPKRGIRERGEDFINKLIELLELRSLMILNYMLEVEKRGTRIEIENSGSNLAGFDHLKSEILAELRVKYKDLEDMVYRMDLSYDEIVDILDVEYIATSSTGYTLSPGFYEISDLRSMLKSLLPDDVKVNITYDNVGLRSNLTTDKIIKFIRKSFSHVQY